MAVEAGDAGDFLHAARMAATGDVDDDVHGLGDQGTWCGHGDFENQLFQPQQRARGGTGMDGRDASRMAGAPSLE